MKNAPPKDLIKFLKPYDPEIQKLALDLRALVLDEMGPCHESAPKSVVSVVKGVYPKKRRPGKSAAKKRTK